MRKIAFFDLDGTLLTQSKEFKAVAVDKELLYYPLKRVYGISYLPSGKLATLRAMHSLGIENIIVTAREIELSTKLDEKFLKYCKKVYFGNGLRCFNLETNEIDLQYDLFNERFFTEIATNAKRVEDIFKRLEVTDDMKIECNLLSNVWKVETSKLENCSYFVPSILHQLQQANLRYIYNADCHILEIFMSSVTKQLPIAYEKSLSEEVPYTVCCGDRIDDFDMMSECTYGVYPVSLIREVFNSTTTAKTFCTSNITALDKNMWFHSNVKEVASIFAKF